jgi:hypothetical protein
MARDIPETTTKELSVADSKSISIARLIAIPAVFTLGVTILRLIGELAHWPAPWFSNAAGGGNALIGISWLPIFFGPYFAVKLARAGKGPSSAGKSIGFAFLGLAVLFLSMVWAQFMFRHITNLLLIPFLLMLAAALIPGVGWRTLGGTLLAYAFAARIPILVVMFLALRGNGGQGWGTHYDAVLPAFAHASLAKKFLYEAFVPQMTLWIGWTVTVGAVCGTLVAAIARLRKRSTQAAA